MSELELSSKHKAMTESNHNHDEEHQQVAVVSQKKMKKRRNCAIAMVVIISFFILLAIIFVILALTLLKTKDPKTEIVSATLQGISPKLTFPAINIQLNITLDLKIRVENKNHASFKHGEGKSVLFYKGIEVGETEIFSGLIPSMGSEILPCRLTLEADKVASNITGFLGDLMGGEITMKTFTQIPGRVTFLGFIKKHIVAKSSCQFIIGVPDFKIKNQENPSPSSPPPSPGPQRRRCFLFPVSFSSSLARRFHLPLPQVARHVVFIFAGFSARNPGFVERRKEMSYLLPHLHSGWAVDQAILAEEERLVVIRFGHDWDETCMQMDEVLASVAETIKNFAVIYLVDITEVPDFNTMYELYDPSTVMFFFRNKHIMIDLGTGNNNKINWALKDKQEFIDIIETVYRGARKGRGLVIAPKDYSTKYRY
ncbi:hypothetical protein Ahy_B04g071666 [Arachis hypogaea]|nr:hypothetical protein Ahy_B04g071666 [Arachis hypogaea]